MLFVFLLILGSLALIAQKCFLPPPWLYGADLVLAPLMVLYGTLYINRQAAWFLAIAVGILTDLLSEAAFGSGGVCLLLMVFLFQTQDIERLRHRWYVQALFALVGTIFFMVLDYTSFCIIQKRWIWNAGLGPYQKIVLTGLLNMFLAPVVFAIMNPCLRWIGLPLPMERVYHDQ